MSDLLTHWAIFDDARRLLRIDSHIEPLLREIVDETESIARLGALRAAETGGRAAFCAKPATLQNRTMRIGAKNWVLGWAVCCTIPPITNLNR